VGVCLEGLLGFYTQKVAKCNQAAATAKFPLIVKNGYKSSN